MSEAAAPAKVRFDLEEIVAGLEEWIRLESPSFDAKAVNRVVDLAQATVEDIGARTERLPGRAGYGDVLIARMPWNDGRAGILVLGHLDTVHPVGSLDTRLPLRREGDRLYGPGVYDMKGGLYSAVCALREVARHGPTPLPITFVFTPDEEMGSPTSRDVIEREAQQSRFVLVPEPAQDDGNLITGRWAFQRFLLRATGKPAHAGATLASGRSAIREIADQVRHVEGLARPDEDVTLSVGVVRGGTFVNVVCAEAEAEVLAVTPTRPDFERVRESVLSLEPLHEGIELAVEPGPVRPLWEPSADGLALYEAARVLAEEIGFSPGHGSVGGGSDGNFAGALGVPTLDGLGLCGGGFHTNDEHVLLSSIVPRTTLLARLFETLR